MMKVHCTKIVILIIIIIVNYFKYENETNKGAVNLLSYSYLTL